jgi:hypothetical protein
MRLVIHNPHTLWYKKTVGSVISGTRSVDKYEPFFNYLYYNNSKVYVFLDNSSFTKFSFRYTIPVLFNFYLWLIINRLSLLKFKIILDSNKLKKDDVLFTFLYENFTNETGVFKVNRKIINSRFEKMSCLKVIHLSHYGYNSKLGATNCRLIGVDYFVAESNLFINSPFFRENFNWYQKDVLVLPFVPGERFIVKKMFKDRKNIAVATGTLTSAISDPVFFDFFKSNILQPMRSTIFENSEFLKNQVDCKISKVKHLVRNKSAYFEHVILKIRSYARLFYFLLNSKDFKYYSNDRDYFKSDIVETYNDYKMFVNPEEIIGLPGIGFVEGMACGAVYIGKVDKMYSDLGMIEGIHYIGYDGSLEDLKSKIEYYQNNQSELETIAANSIEFVQTRLNSYSVYTKFIKEISFYLAN